MRQLLKIIAISLLALSSTYAQVIETDRGKIEFLGLKSWDAKTLLDSIRNLNPGQPIHACAAEMKNEFGFLEVSNVTHLKSWSDLSTMHSVITVVEKSDGDKLKYLPSPPDSFEILDDYFEPSQVIAKNRMNFEAIINTYSLIESGHIDSAKTVLHFYGSDYESVKSYYDFMLNKKDLQDMNLALWILNNDANIHNRQVALTILLNFSEYDITWWTLLNIQRYKNAKYRVASSDVLRKLSEHPRPIDWTNSYLAIKSIINGTNLWAFGTTLDALAKTKISSDLSDRILHDSSGLLISSLKAEHEGTRESAKIFVQQISGDTVLKTSTDCIQWLEEF